MCSIRQHRVVCRTYFPKYTTLLLFGVCVPALGVHSSPQQGPHKSKCTDTQTTTNTHNTESQTTQTQNNNEYTIKQDRLTNQHKPNTKMNNNIIILTLSKLHITSMCSPFSYLETVKE